MDIEELCTVVNELLDAAEIEVADGRTSARVTPRHIRYYRTIGLLPPPQRESGRAVYDHEHVKTVVAIKRAQADGTSLATLKERTDSARTFRPELPVASFMQRYEPTVHYSARVVDDSLTMARHSIDARPMAAIPTLAESIAALNAPQRGWSVRLGGVTLSGTGTAPNDEQLRRIREVLNVET